MCVCVYVCACTLSVLCVLCACVCMYIVCAGVHVCCVYAWCVLCMPCVCTRVLCVSCIYAHVRVCCVHMCIVCIVCVHCVCVRVCTHLNHHSPSEHPGVHGAHLPQLTLGWGQTQGAVTPEEEGQACPWQPCAPWKVLAPGMWKAVLESGFWEKGWVTARIYPCEF